MMRAEMKPVLGFSAVARQAVRAVLTDIDDTLTEGGRLPAAAYLALERLKEAGFIVIPVTGRPAGWCDLIARQWPVDGIVGENGAFYFRYKDQERRMVRSYAKSEAERTHDRRRLSEIERSILCEVAGSAVASDQAYREADLAIDFQEDIAPLPEADITRIVNVFERYGATAKVSSIHVNGWFGTYDKLSTSIRMLADEFGINVSRHPEHVVFVGDSPNDAPMFAFFPHAVGVANTLDFLDTLPAVPAWITRGKSARGFVELADLLIDARVKG
jgi:HAD superfamily hydrolase (TIGR01484 family)